MNNYVYDTSPNPGDEGYEAPVKQKNVRTRCTAKTISGRICRNKKEKDCSYCKMHGEMFRVTIPTYQVPGPIFFMNELRPCPKCLDNITYGSWCNTCIQS